MSEKAVVFGSVSASELSRLERIIAREVGLLGRDGLTVFALPGRGVGVALEVRAQLRAMLDLDALARHVSDVVTRCRGDAPHVIVLLEPGDLPRSQASGRRQRAACSRRFSDGTLPGFAVYRDGVRVDAGARAANGDVRVDPAPSATETALAAIWQDVLVQPSVRPSDSFFGLGGSSLAATQMAAAVERQLGVTLDVGLLFQAPTLRELAARIEQRRQGPGGGEREIIARIPRHDRLPLSSTQQRMRFVWQLDPEGGAYNICGALRVHGDLQPHALQETFDFLVTRHEALRTSFPELDGQPYQKIEPPRGVRIERDELWRLPETERGATQERLLAAEANAPFDLAAGPLLRVRLVVVGSREHVLIVTLHHSVADGASMNVLVRDFAQAYAAYARGELPRLEPLSIQYADYAAWQERRLREGQAEGMLAYFKEQLGEAQPGPLELPANRARPPSQSFGGQRLAFPVPEALVVALRALARQLDASAFMLLLGAFGVLLHKLTGVRSVRVGVPAVNRLRAQADDVLGAFVNTQVLCLRIDPRASFTELVRDVKRSVLGAQSRQDLPFERLVEELEPERSPAYHPLFQVMFNHQHRDLRALEQLPGLEATLLDVESPSTRFDLSLNTEEDHTGRLSAAFVYATDLFDADRVEGFREQYLVLLAALLADAQRSLGSAEWLPSGERARAEAWSLTPWTAPAGSVCEWIAERTREQPAAAALTFGDHTISYAQLVRLSDALAQELRARGAGPDVIVGVLLERSIELVVGLLAISKTGAAYLPLDLDAPEERLAFLLQDAGAGLLLCDRHELGAALVPERVLVDPSPVLARAARASVRVTPVGWAAPHRENLAYVIYTSGSSGLPKGVGSTHGALAQRLAWMQHEYGLSSSETLLHKTPLIYDVSVWEVFWPLMAGAHLVIAGPGEHRDPARLARLLERHAVSTIHFVPSLLRDFIEQDLTGCRLRRLFSGGEALSADLCELLLERLPGVRVDNRYGPTETLINATFWTCRREPSGPVPIGYPIPSTAVRILDAELELAPLGYPGELCIGGAGLARGYVGRAALTAERFVPDAFAVEPGQRLYRSGDVARRRDDGAIEYLGRKDEQVKIRGTRVELGEVDALLRALPGVEEAAAGAQPGPGGVQRLIGYLVTSDALDPTKLRQELERRASPQLVPSQLVQVERLPRLPSGKLDRRALPAPSWQAAAYVAPETYVERRVSEVWCEVLGLQSVGLADHFFELGGHSLLATQVVSRIRRGLDVEVALRDVFEAPVLDAFAQRVQLAFDAGRKSRWPKLLPIDRSRPLPLSYAQERMWFLWSLEPQSPAYNVGGAVRLRGPLNLAALEQGLDALIQRHEALRTSFPRRDGVPVQLIAADHRVRLGRRDLCGLGVEAQALEVEREKAAEASRPFDLERGPLLRSRLLRLALEEHLLIVTLHHIVAEGWAMDIFAQEWAALYEAFCAGQPSPLEPLPVQYADYAAWQRQWLTEGEAERQLTYYRAALGGDSPVLELPADRPRPSSQSFRGDYLRFELPPGLTERVRSFARAHGATLPMTLTAAFCVLLHRLTGERDLRIGCPVANRIRPEFEGLIGAFLNMYVLRCELREELTVAELVERVKRASIGAQSNQDVPFHWVVEAVQPRRSASHLPLFQVMSNVQHWRFQERRSVAGLSIEFEPNDSRAAKCDLSLDVSEVDGRLECSFTYSLDLFERPSVERMIQVWTRLLDSMLTNPAQRLFELDMVDAPAFRSLLAAAAGAPVDTSNLLDLPSAFEHAAERWSGHIALEFGEAQLSYGELNQRANRLAHRLREMGIGADSVVALCLERSPDLIIAALAILKVGAAYLPIDPSYPAQRIRHMLEDSAVLVIVAREALLGALPETSAVIWCVDRDAQELSAMPAHDPLRRLEPGHLAYCIYTSGSTGRPKGVEVTHHGLSNYIAWAATAYDIARIDTSFMHSSIGFDLTVTSLWLPLAAGKRVRLIPDGEAALEALAAELGAATGSTLLKLTPSHVLALRELMPATAAAITWVVGGEALSLECVAALRGMARESRIFNEYGPTETVVGCSVFEVGRDVELGVASSVPIGVPIQNTELFVLDGVGQAVLPGVTGELYIGGQGLARGYRQRPSLTAECFVPHPYARTPGERLYRTGDRARAGAGGLLQYLGRRDQQLKIRGHRVELGEIEAVLREHALVRDAVVVARRAGPSVQLVGYVLPTVNVQADADALASRLSAHLSGRLPEHMLPARWVVLSELPLTENGKLDRARLPEPSPLGSSTSAAPSTPLERTLAAIWRDVLGLSEVSAEDNFFELGGDSILSLQVVSRAREQGLRLLSKHLFQHQTLRALAAAASASADLVTTLDTATGAVPLTPMQRRLLAAELAEPAHYNQSLLLVPERRLEPETLARAVRDLVAHHDGLRLRFARDARGEWQQHYGTLVDEIERWEREPGFTSATNVAPEHLEATCAVVQRSLELARGPLFRAALLDLAGGGQRLLLVAHHLVMDGVSLRILVQDLQTLYEQLERGEPPQLPAKTSSFKAWAERLVGHASSPELQAELGYWRAAALDDGAALALPVDNPAGALTFEHRASWNTTFDTETTLALQKQASPGYRAQPHELLLTALARVLCRWSAQPSIQIEIEGHGREPLFDDIDTNRTLGWFTACFPLRVGPVLAEGEQSLALAIRGVKEQLRGVPHKGIGYGVLRYLGGAGELAGSTPARVTFNYHGRLETASGRANLFTLADESAGPNRHARAPLDNWLCVEAYVARGQLTVQWVYSREMWREETVARLAAGFRGELEAMLARSSAGERASSVSASDFPLAELGSSELEQLPFALEELEDAYPLSPAQQGILFHSLYSPGTDPYINQLRVDVNGLDVARFRQAWQYAVDRHACLRTSFWQRPAGGWLQLVRRAAEVSFEERSGQGADAAGPAGAERVAQQELARAFDPTELPLSRIVLVPLSDGRYHLIWTHHHLLTDGWSSARLLEEVATEYAGERLPAAPASYRSYIEWLQRRDRAADERYWKSELARLEEPTLLAETHTAPAAGHAYARISVRWDARDTAELRRCLQRERITLGTWVYGAWALLLQRHARRRAVVFGATVAGRPAELAESATSVGLFINTLPVVAAPSASSKLGDWLRALQGDFTLAREHEHTPLSDILRWGGRSSQSLFDSLVVLENYPVGRVLRERGPGGLEFGTPLSVEQTNYALTLSIHDEPELRIDFDYEKDQLEESRARSLAQGFELLLRQLSSAGERPLGGLALASSSDVEALRRWNATRVPYPLELCLHEVIEAQVERTPDAIALVFGDQRATYAELDARANQLAWYFRELGIGPDSLVGVCLERCFELPVLLLGILKAGAAYVPLDAEYPRERLAFMVEDSGIALLLTETRLVERLPALDARLWCLDRDTREIDRQPRVRVPNRAHADNLAYCIYTSGSSGQPKGAGNSHRAIHNRLRWMQDEYGLAGSDRVLQKTPFSFDVSVWEFFWPLMSGATLVVAAPGVQRDPAALAREIIEQGVTILHFVPSMLEAFVASGQLEGCSSLRQVMSSGEALPLALAQRFLERHGAELHNLYGPTEAAVDVTYFACRRGLAGNSVPIGAPIANTSIYVLAPTGEQQPVGVAGELCIGGVALARGYHRRPSLTASRFLPDFFSERPGQRMYRTGDLVRWLPAGELEYLGRLDEQVKIRGYRIELGEIEARLREQPEVRDAAVVAHSASSGKQLVAYVVLERKEPETGQLLRERLGRLLPEYMLPAQILALDALPLTPSGKLDRRALPAPAWEGQSAYVEPSSVVERQLAEIWRSVLGVSRVGLTDSFFELGGDSIISLELVSRARRLGLALSPRDLFEHPTLGALSRVARMSVATPACFAGSELEDRASSELAPIQRWFFEQPMSSRDRYNQALLLRLRAPLDPSSLTRALELLVENHEALRVRYERGAAGQWRPLPLDVASARARWKGAPLLWQRRAEDDAAFARCVDAAQGSLSLAAGELLRALLIQLPDGSERLLLVIHHLAIDGVSWRIALSELEAGYRQLGGAEDAQPAARTSSFGAWTAALRGLASDPGLTSELEYWQAQLGAPAARELPRDFDGSALVAQRAVVAWRLGEVATERLLRQAPAAYRTRSNDLLLTALSRALCRFAGQKSVVLELEGHGREGIVHGFDLTRTVGWFTSMHPVRLEPGGGEDLGFAIKAVKEQLRAIPRGGLGYGVLSCFGDEATREILRAAPRPRVTFNYLGQLDRSFEASSLFDLADESPGIGQASDAPLINWITINGQVSGGQLALSCTYSTAMYRDETIQRLMADIKAELEALIEHCASGARSGVTPSDFPLAGLTQSELDALPVPARMIADLYPLSPMQQGMLFHSVFGQEPELYVNQLSVRVRGLDVQRLERAWQRVIERHPILRTGFLGLGDGQPLLQVVHAAVGLEFGEASLNGPTLETALAELAREQRALGFELSRPPLQRVLVVGTAPGEHQLIWTYHHAMLDGWSSARLFEEVLGYYLGEAPARAAGSYREYIAWLEGRDRAATEAFWRDRLRGLDEPTMLSEQRSGAEGALPRRRLRISAGPETSGRFLRFAQRQQVTLSTLVQAAWLMVLQRSTRQRTLVFGLTIAGRPPELEGAQTALGSFINTLPMIEAPRHSQSVASWLRQVGRDSLELEQHGHAALVDVQRWAGRSGQPLFDSIIAFENYPIDAALRARGTGSLDFGAPEVVETTNYPLVLVINQRAELSFEYVYSPEHFSEPEVRRLAEQLLAMLGELALDPERRLGALCVPGPEERRRILAHGMGRGQHEWTRGMPEPFEVCVARTPEAIALLDGDAHLSYAGLNRRSNRLARALRERGCGPDVLVGVLLERSAELVVALLAILKAGAAYLPLDPESPDERLAYVARDSGISLVLSDERLLARAPEGLEIWRVDAHTAPAPEDDQNLGQPIHPLQLAYCMYTSGSTGHPKAVQLTHAGFANYVRFASAAYCSEQIHDSLVHSSVAFDLTVTSLWVPLCSGRRIELVAREGTSLTALSTALSRSGGAGLLKITPSHAEALAEMPIGPLRGVRVWVVGGEALSRACVAKLHQLAPQSRVINEYGPTEAVVGCATHEASRSSTDQAASIPIGVPIAGAGLYVVDAAFQPASLGVAGELCIGGVGVARGYLGRPSLTAERFVPDPFGERPGQRLYRSGDLAALGDDGELVYHGRLDRQVKLRGYRIELAEIEAKLREQACVQQAAVVQRQVGASKQLVAYVVLQARHEAELGELQERLGRALPAYMVPREIVALEALPLTSNGKLDEARLPAPERAHTQARVAPRTELEDLLARIWSEALGVERVGVTENFFELGGDSISSLRLVNRALTRGLRLRPRDIFECQTVEALALRLAAAPGLSDEPASSRSPAAPSAAAPAEDVEGGALIQDTYPVTPLQRGILFHALDAADREVYVSQVCLDIEGLHLGRLALAWQALTDRHEALRTAFRLSGASEPRQVVHAHVAADVEELELSAEDDGRSRLHTLAAAERARGFELEQAPLQRLVAVRVAPGRHRLIWTYHHAILDGWSHAKLVEELLRAYAREPLAAPPAPYREHVEWLRQQDAAAAQRFWKEQLASLSQPTLLSSSLPRAREAEGHAQHTLRLSEGETAALVTFARRERVTLNTMVQAAWLLLLQRYTGQRCVAAGVTLAGRPAALPGVDAMVGLFINTLPLIQSPAPQLAVGEWLRELQQHNLALREYEYAPLYDVQRWSGRAGRALFDSLIVFENYPLTRALDAASRGGVTCSNVEAFGPNHYALTLIVSAERSLRCDFAYDGSCFDPEQVRTLAGQLAHLLEQIVASSKRALGALAVACPEEVTQLRRWLAPRRAYAPVDCLHARIEEVAERWPDRVALTCSQASVSYGELNRRANRLARHLRAQGVGPELLVGVCLQRTSDLLVALLGVLKAGAGYLPLDPDYPAERLAFMLSDSEAKWVITEVSAAEKLNGVSAARWCIDRDWADTDGCADENLPHRPHPHNLAYCIYTSGSTGRPKGALITHDNVVRLFKATASEFDVGGEDVWSLFHSYAFDFSVWEIFGAWLSGGRVVVVSHDTARAPDDFWELLARERVTVLSQTPSAFRGLLHVAGQSERRTQLRYIVFGGEALEGSHVRAWMERFGDEQPRLINMYGITETTVHVTACRLTRVDAQSDTSPVGVALDDLACHVLDPVLQPLPAGGCGELFVAGAGLARGYLKRPGLTAQRFVPDSLSGLPGARLYRSGDLARWRRDGTLEYAGRIDQQVKIRGHRIELGEIAARVREYGSVRDVAVVARETPHGQQLVAYVVADLEGEAALALVAGLRDHLRGVLPEAMQLAHIVVLGELPLTPNGKLDRDALPAPAAQPSAENEPPRSELEAELARVWQGVLNLERIARGDNFFELGGDSIVALQVVSRLRELGIPLSPRDLFQHQTVAAVARVVVDRAAERQGRLGAATPNVSGSPVPAWRAEEPRDDTGGAGRYPLTPLQQGMLFHSLHGGQPRVYLSQLTVSVQGLDVVRFRAAWQDVITRHDVLRTAFVAPGGGQALVQVVHPELPVPLREVELRGANRERLRELERDEWLRELDYARPPLFWLLLARVGDDRHHFIWTYHHTLVDGWSRARLIEEVLLRYEGKPLHAPRGRYRDYIAWLSQQDMEACRQFWRRELAPLEVPTLLARTAAADLAAAPHARTALPASGPSRELRMSLDAVRGEALRNFAQRQRVTLNTMFQAAWLLLLHRHTGLPTVACGTTVAGRPASVVDVERIVGLFINTLPVIQSPRPEWSVGRWLSEVQDTNLELRQFEHTPLYDIQRWAGHGGQPLFDTLVVFENYPVDAALRKRGSGGELSFGPVTTQSGSSFPLNIEISAEPELSIKYAFSTAHFSEPAVVALGKQLLHLLTEMLSDPARPLAALSLCPEGELPKAGGALLPDATSEPWLHQQIEARARELPHLPALRFGEEQLTFAELNARANRVAHWLRAMGVGREGRVGCCLRRSPALVVALVGIAKAGAAYVPLDPDHPEARLRHMMEGSGLDLVLTEAELSVRLPATRVPVRCVDAAGSELSQHPSIDVSNVNGPLDLVYCIHTSGSSGRPKAVQLTHSGLANYLRWAAAAYRIEELDGSVLHSSVGFDLSVTSLWLPLCAGKCVELAPEEMHAVDALAKALERARGTQLLKLTPSHALALAERAPRVGSAVRAVVVGGEVLTGECVAAIERVAPGARIFNEYGPTEAVVGCCVQELEAIERRSTDSVPIGLPIDNAPIYVLGAELQRLPASVQGELYIGGPVLARGYHGRASLTAERFVPDPFAAAPGARMYRTGDLGSYDREGRLSYRGRVDHQVKLRGYRIELGEIEACLREHPLVREAVVVARDGAGGGRLVAYVVPKGEPAPPDAALLQHLAGILPSYMLPSHIELMSELPLTHNGKLDRAALPDPARSAEEYVEPASALGRRLAAIWRDALGVERVGGADGFLALGGHSVLAMQVLSRIQTELGCDVPLQCLLDSRSLSEFERAVEARRPSPQEPWQQKEL